MMNPAINNVIWRMATGERSSTKDPKLKHLTELLDLQFKAFDPQTLLTVLQLKFPWFNNLCKFLNIKGSCAIPYEGIMEFVEDAIKDQTPGIRFYTMKTQGFVKAAFRQGGHLRGALLC